MSSASTAGGVGTDLNAAFREDEPVIGSTGQGRTESHVEDGQRCQTVLIGWDGSQHPTDSECQRLGLFMTFVCEICHGHPFFGRIAYERHFQDWMHQFWMRQLNIPNTKPFNEIASIEEVRQALEAAQLEERDLNQMRQALEAVQLEGGDLNQTVQLEGGDLNQ